MAHLWRLQCCSREHDTQHSGPAARRSACTVHDAGVEHQRGRFISSLHPSLRSSDRIPLQAPAQPRALGERPRLPSAAPAPSRSALVVRATAPEGEEPADAGEARVLVVTSGKGGVGKTTSTANLGMSIARYALVGAE
jgi:hypothetical protein